MDATKMLDTRVRSELCTCYMTSSGGPEWPHRCRRQSATVSNASSMNALVPKPQCDPSLLLLLWSCYTLTFTSIETTMELDEPPYMVNVLVFCDHLWPMPWHRWPHIKLLKPLLSFCVKDISPFKEQWPSSWVTEEPNLKATSPESFASL